MFVVAEKPQKVIELELKLKNLKDEFKIRLESVVVHSLMFLN